jgi:hypothetical protein
MVSAASSSAGTTITQGCSVMPPRFSEIISAQSAAGGCRPRPRKFTDAIRRIELVSLSPASAKIGPSAFGSISRRSSALVFSPRTTAAST